jgi:hypothetical protein
MVKISISDEILAEIGKIVVVHGLIEDSLANIIGSIVSIKTRPELGKVVTAELSFKQLISTLSSLLTLCLGKKHECTTEFESVKKLLYSAEQQRNLIVHSVWVNHDEPESPSVFRIKTTAKDKVGLRTQFVKLDAKEIQAITGLVADAYAALSLFELRFQKDDSEQNARLDA